MVIGLLILSSIPSVTGVCQAISAQSKRDQRGKDERRMKKFNIDIRCRDAETLNPNVEGSRLLLRDGKAYAGPTGANRALGDGYVAEAFYIEYPDNERVPVATGLVSQVQDDPPLLNWIYVDKHTMEVKYGNKSASIEHHVGSWDWCDSEEFVTLERPDGRQAQLFVAVYNKSVQRWQLFFDMHRDGLEGVVPEHWIRETVALKRMMLE